jgi:hypothetical protein
VDGDAPPNRLVRILVAALLVLLVVIAVIVILNLLA